MSLDGHFESLTRWRDELSELRRVVLSCGLSEARKWRQPCYMDQERNILILGVMKRHCVVSFLKGSLLSDPEGRLIQPGERSQSVRYLAFTSLEEVKAGEVKLRSLIQQAVELERAGQKVALRSSEEPLAPELQQALEEDHELREAFSALTPGRQRAYNIQISQAKQSATRVKRIAQHRARILEGRGLNDCVCGRTKRPPRCDGSHRELYEG